MQVSADDRWLSEIVLEAPDAWVRTTLPLPRRPTRRRYRRVDLRVDRTIGQESYGVQVGEIALEREKIYN